MVLTLAFLSKVVAAESSIFPFQTAVLMPSLALVKVPSDWLALIVICVLVAAAARPDGLNSTMERSRIQHIPAQAIKVVLLGGRYELTNNFLVIAILFPKILLCKITAQVFR